MCASLKNNGYAVHRCVVFDMSLSWDGRKRNGENNLCVDETKCIITGTSIGKIGAYFNLQMLFVPNILFLAYFNGNVAASYSWIPVHILMPCFCNKIELKHKQLVGNNLLSCHRYMEKFGTVMLMQKQTKLSENRPTYTLVLMLRISS